jgi:hypothetical protein
MLTHALRYLARGWSVIPLCSWDHRGCDQAPAHDRAACEAAKKQGKRPLVAWGQFQERKATSEEARQWWERWPGANIGIDSETGLAQLQRLAGIDTDQDPAEALQQFRAGNVAFKTGMYTGHRLLFALGGLDPPQRVFTTGKREDWKFQARGGYTVAPPSIHGNGNTYQWCDGHKEIEPQQVPQWLLNAISRPEVIQNGRERESVVRLTGHSVCPSTREHTGDSAVQATNERIGLDQESGNGSGSRDRSTRSNPQGTVERICEKSSDRPDAIERARAYLSSIPVCNPLPSDPMDASTHLLKAASAMVGFALDDATACVLLEEWDQANPAGPYSQAEYQRKLNEARKTGHVKEGELLNVPRRIDIHVNGRSTADSARSAQPAIRLPQQSGHGDSSPPGTAGHRGTASDGQPHQSGKTTHDPTTQTRTVPASMTARQLLDLDLPPIKWIVPSLIPEGGLLLAGRPKGGKSWLALQLCLSIAEGASVWSHFAATQAETLYVALEDGQRRLQSRLQRLAGSERLIGHGLHLAWEWPTLGQGCIDSLERWLDLHPAVRLVAVDTLTRVRDRSATVSRGNSYEMDYDSVSPFTRIGQERGICVGIVHHTRKPKESEKDEDDPFDAISGTTGLSGAADLLMVLRRPPGSSEARLYTRGRDTEDQTLQLCWDSDLCLWSVHSGPTLPPEQQKALECLQKAGKPLSPHECFVLLNKPYEATKKLLKRMADEGRIENVKGKYAPWPTQRTW